MHKRQKTQTNAIDVHIGLRVRLARIQRGASLRELSAALGIPNRLMRDFENGAARIGALDFFKISRVLNKPARFFYEDAPVPAMRARASGAPVYFFPESGA